LIADHAGASLVEYAMLVALLAVVCIVGITQWGDATNRLWGMLVTRLSTLAS